MEIVYGVFAVVVIATIVDWYNGFKLLNYIKSDEFAQNIKTVEKDVETGVEEVDADLTNSVNNIKSDVDNVVKQVNDITTSTLPAVASDVKTLISTIEELKTLIKSIEAPTPTSSTPTSEVKTSSTK